MNRESKKFQDLYKKVEASVREAAFYISQVSPVEVEDAKQQLAVAVWKASKKYNPNKGAKETTLAVCYIKTELKAIIATSYRKFRDVDSNSESLNFVEEEKGVEFSDPRVDTQAQVGTKVYAEQVRTKIRTLIVTRIKRLGQGKCKHALKVYDLFMEGNSLSEVAKLLKTSYYWTRRVWVEQIEVSEITDQIKADPLFKNGWALS